MAFATFDYKRFPRFLQVHLQNSPSSDAEFQEYMQGLHDMYTHQKSFSLLFDASRLSPHMSPQYLLQQAMYMKESEDNARKYLQKIAIVTNSVLVKGLINNLFLIHRPVSDTKIFTDKKEALRWLFNIDK